MQQQQQKHSLTSRETCFSTSQGSMPADLFTMLTSMQNSIQEICVNVGGLDAKMGGVGLSITSIEQHIAKMPSMKSMEQEPGTPYSLQKVHWKDTEVDGKDTEVVTKAQQLNEKEYKYMTEAGASDTHFFKEALMQLQAEQATLIREFQQFPKTQRQDFQKSSTRCTQKQQDRTATSTSQITRPNSSSSSFSVLTHCREQEPAQQTEQFPKTQRQDSPRQFTARSTRQQHRSKSNLLLAVSTQAHGREQEPAQQTEQLEQLELFNRRAKTEQLEQVHASTLTDQIHHNQGPAERILAEARELEENQSNAESQRPVMSHMSVTKSTKSRRESLHAIFSHVFDLDTAFYNVEDFYSKQGINQCIARSNFFAQFTIAVVVLNAVYIGIDSDHNHANNIYDAQWWFQACSQFFCVYFTWELVVRFLAFEHKGDSLRDGWFKFDSFLVFTMILELWIIMPTLHILGGAEVTVPTQPLRMLRLVKLTRLGRLMSALPELVTIVKGLVRSIRAITSSMILIGLLVYVWGIILHMLLKDQVKLNDKLWEDSMLGFGSLTMCMWTLLTGGTLMGAAPGPLVTGLLVSPKVVCVVAGAMFMVYVILSAMVVLNMVIGVLCDVMTSVRAEEQEAHAVEFIQQELLGTLELHDDGEGMISVTALKQVMSSPMAIALMQKLNINRAYYLLLQDMLFDHGGKSACSQRLLSHQLSGKPSGQLVPIKAVLELMIICRGANVTTVEGMSGGFLTIIREIGAVRQILEQDMVQLEADLQAAMGKLEQDLQADRRADMDDLSPRAILQRDTTRYL